MKAFLASLALLVVITVAAAYGLQLVPMSSQDIYTQHDSVRL